MTASLHQHIECRARDAAPAWELSLAAQNHGEVARGNDATNPRQADKSLGVFEARQYLLLLAAMHALQT